MELNRPYTACEFASLGDVHFAAFEAEAEAVLFVPGSGEVFLTSREAWAGLSSRPPGSPASIQLSQVLRSAGARLE
jgi:hypothetical protein